jgi:hypothetical protein
MGSGGPPSRGRLVRGRDSDPAAEEDEVLPVVAARPAVAAAARVRLVGVPKRSTHQPPRQRPALRQATAVFPMEESGGELLTGDIVYASYAHAAVSDFDHPFGHLPSGEPLSRWTGAATVVAPVRSRERSDTVSTGRAVWISLPGVPWVYIHGSQLTRQQPVPYEPLCSGASEVTEPSQVSHWQ